jgi:FkbM family methyltransferase
MYIPFEKIFKTYNNIVSINGVLHIGAAGCEELEEYRKFGLTNDKIIWVEANPKQIEEVKKKDSTIIIKNFICCDKDTGETELKICSKSTDPHGHCSSILDLGEGAKRVYGLRYVTSIKIKNNRIDTMYKKDNIPKNFANFVNIDIQGAELLALKGMGDLLHNFDYVYTEVNNTHDVYKECCLVDEIDTYLSKYGFIRKETAWNPGWKTWGDSLYIKESKFKQ